jgi:hypothetical protein
MRTVWMWQKPLFIQEALSDCSAYCRPTVLAVTVLQDLSLSSYTFSDKISHRSIIADYWFRLWVSPREISGEKLATRVRPFFLSISRDQFPALAFSFMFLSLGWKLAQPGNLHKNSTLCQMMGHIVQKCKKQSRYRPGVAQRVPGS